jgi:hypothetical protein
VGDANLQMQMVTQRRIFLPKEQIRKQACITLERGTMSDVVRWISTDPALGKSFPDRKKKKLKKKNNQQVEYRSNKYRCIWRSLAITNIIHNRWYFRFGKRPLQK